MTSLPTRAVHLWQKRHTPEAKRLFRYTMVSVVSTVVSFGVLALVFGVFHLWGEIGEHRLRQRGGDGAVLLPQPDVGRGARAVGRT